MEWQPIKTAPKDGAWVLLYCPDGVDERSYQTGDAPDVTIGRHGPADYQEADWFSVEHHYEFWDYGGLTGAGTTDYLIRVNPTHWMPLPPLPE